MCIVEEIFSPSALYLNFKCSLRNKIIFYASEWIFTIIYNLEF